MKHNDYMRYLEDVIDMDGLSTLLGDIATICREKAEHIQASYAIDSATDPLARQWNNDADKIERVAEKVTVS